VHARQQGEDYGQLMERVGLDALVEDDCASIGGTAHTCAAQLSAASRQSVRCIVLPEFSGLGELPGDPAELLTLGGPAS
jgi:orotate phosphoribosyltransferase-like protein